MKMPLHIQRVEADVDMAPRRGEGEAPPEGSSRRELDVERLRPIVLQILEEEMSAFRRQQG